MKINDFMYIYPPRPKTSVDFNSEVYKSLMMEGYIAQIKANGQRNLTYTLPGDKVEFWNRHKSRHLNYKFPEWLIQKFKDSVNLPSGINLLDGELLHTKGPEIKDTMYFWDILVYNGEYLIGTTYEERFELLKKSFPAYDSSPVVNGVVKIDEKIWVAKNYKPEDWEELWKLTRWSHVEGQVIKNLKGRLQLGVKQENNGDWQTRSRRPSKSYQF